MDDDYEAEGEEDTFSLLTVAVEKNIYGHISIIFMSKSSNYADYYKPMGEISFKSPEDLGNIFKTVLETLTDSEIEQTGLYEFFGKQTL